MDRKEFLKTCGFACAAVAFSGVLLESCGSTNYFARFTAENSKIIISKKEFTETVKEKVIQRKYVLIKADRFSFPICVYKISDEIYTSLLMECTHKSCELQPHGDFLICPCHGSEFTNRGEVQNPPAEQNLQSFKTTVDHENVYVFL